MALEQDIFIAAVREAPADRRAFLDRACGADRGLRQRVDQLLAAHDRAGSFLADPAVATPLVGAGPLANSGAGDVPIGAVLDGKYHIVEVIGEGGMGRVYFAHQIEPVKRPVAVKVIKAGMDSQAVLARFAAERQALAMMDHPHIAQVFDAGATAVGRPYFVMELVRGVPITQYCDEHRLPPRQRLELFVLVCQAIQHAHQKGVIHRDIKPSNVLVGQCDDRPLPKVIDFGVAKAAGTTLIDRTLHTGIGTIVGTPEYMSPEQADVGNDDVDTRSDVYSLGVLLYELLTGSTPVDRNALPKATLLEILRIVREVESPRPSAKLSVSNAAPGVAACRGTELAKLAQLLKGELDWVVLKTLEKDRTRRYESANALARDIQRYLADEVVEARPPTAGYRLKKFVRRHRGQVIAASVVLLTLVGGIVGTSIGIVQAVKAWDAESARAESEAEQRRRAVQAEAEAKGRAAELEELLKFQTQMLRQVDPAASGLRLTSDVLARFDTALAKAGVPEKERGQQLETFKGGWSRVNATDAARELIASTILNPAADTIDKQFQQQPVVAAALRQTLGECYLGLGLYDAAKPMLEKALATRREALGEDHADTMTSIGAVGLLLRRLGRYTEAADYYREELRQRRRVFGPEHSSTLTAVNNMGFILDNQGKRAEALAHFREALTTRRRVLGDDHPDTLVSISGTSALLWSMGRREEAMPLYREVLDKRRQVLGADHQDTLISMSHMSNALRDQGHFQEAVKLMQEVLDKHRRLYGDVHPTTLNSIRNLGVTLPDIGKEAEGEQLMREAVVSHQHVLGADHPRTLIALNNLAAYLIERGKLTEAEPKCRESLERHRRVLGTVHPATLTASSVMGYVLLRQNKPELAEPFVREALDISRRINGEDHKDTFVYEFNLGAVLYDQKKFDEAEITYRAVYERSAKILGETDPVPRTALRRLATSLNERQRWAESAALFAAAEPAYRRAAAPAGEQFLAALLTTLGKARNRLAQYAEADANLLEAHGLWVKTRGAAHADTAGCVLAIVDHYAAWHRAEPNAGFADMANSWREKLPKEKK